MGFDSIDNCPCSIFDKVNLTGNVELVGGLKNWQKINDEFVSEFGISEEFEKWLKLMGQYCKYLNEAINGKDRSKINFANKFKVEADAILNKPINNVDKYVVASKFMGFRVNPTEYTVKEFYNIIKLMNNGKED